MKANELRIGNWLEYKGSKATIQVEHSEITEVYFGATNYIPIPLTEEWLLNLGGVRDNNAPYIDFGYFELSKTENNWWSVEKEGVRLCFVKYVHQLQNLYFALTEEELKIK